MAQTSLASSVFVRKPDQETVVADVYTTTTTTPINSFQDISSTGFELDEKFSFLSSVTSEKILQAAAADVGADKETMADKIDGALPGDQPKAKSMLKSAIDVGKLAIKEIKEKKNAVTGLLKQAKEIKATVNGVVSTIKSGDLKSLSGISNAVNAIAGKTSLSLSATGALGGIYTSLVGQAGGAGVKDAFGLVASGIKEASNIADKSKVLYQVATGSLPAAVKRGDWKSVSSMCDTIGKGSVSMMKPDVLTTLSKTIKDKFTPSEIGGSAGQFVAYKDAYQKIDPNWDKSKWIPLGGSSAPMKDLSCLMDASPETREVFVTGAKMSDDGGTDYLAMLEKFPGSMTVDGEISKRYPMSPSANVVNIMSKDVDPLLYGTTIK